MIELIKHKKIIIIIKYNLFKFVILTKIYYILKIY